MNRNRSQGCGRFAPSAEETSGTHPYARSTQIRESEDSEVTTISDTRPAITAPDARKLAPLAGILAGPLFLTTVALLTWAEAGYMHRLGWRYTKNNNVPWPSGLALGPDGWIQIVNFAITGQLALALLTVLGAALTVSAFPTDHGAAAGKNPNTWHGWIHSAAFVGVAVPAIVGPVFVALALRRDPSWRPLPALSALVPPLLVGAFIAQHALHDVAFTGFLVIVFAWLAALAGRLRRFDANSVGPSEGANCGAGATKLRLGT